MKPDSDLRDDVLAALHWDPAVTSRELEVVVDDGTVVFTGRLTSHAEKRAIERTAACISGVRGLVFETVVELPADSVRSDGALAAAVEHALEWNTLVPRDCVVPTIEQGWITLNGTVPWAFNRHAAERAVRELTGVTGITNRIVVAPQAMAGDIERGIQDALVRQAYREGQQITVEVAGSVVTLHGCVHSIAERKAIQAAAWASPGVSSVINAIVVHPAHEAVVVTDIVPEPD